MCWKLTINQVETELDIHTVPQKIASQTIMKVRTLSQEVLEDTSTTTTNNKKSPQKSQRKRKWDNQHTIWTSPSLKTWQLAERTASPA